MPIPLQNARLCLDCDTVFEEAQCPACGSTSFFPLSRWVRPAMESEGLPVNRKNAKKVSLLLAGSALAGSAAGFALWRFFKKPPDKPSE
jgi:hypothetical protein